MTEPAAWGPQPGARPGMKVYDEPLAESHAEAWYHLDQWAIHGEVLFAVNALAERQA
ncbi:hypothetical protein ACFWY6_42740 [Streptomyces sp. NPDC059037]|uniref:hypothetical protein n=1 Tax=Streptomyces sp. NPDC059037 TaxID=3346710 RepID=UPI003683075A